MPKHLPVVGTPVAFKPVVQALAFIEIVELRSEVRVHLVNFDWLRLHSHVPDLDSQKVA